MGAIKSPVGWVDVRPSMVRSVLIVDDDPMALRLLAHHLTKEGYDVICAESGRDALELLRSERPSMVITDWMMPDVSGRDVCEAVRAGSDQSFVYIIVLTAQSAIDRVVEAFDAGADDYLTKPFNQRELLARVRAGDRIVDLERRLANERTALEERNAELEDAHAQLQDVNRELDRMATTDALTGALNRRAAIRALEDAWASVQHLGESLSVVIFDIDHFKSINDTYGHDVGDEALCTIAKALNKVTRKVEDLYRIGGEEFLLICPKTTASEASNAAERMRDVVEHSVRLSGAPQHVVTMSVGVAEVCDGMTGYEELLRAADEALYSAKRSGRNRVHVDRRAFRGSRDDGMSSRRASA